MKTPFQIEIPRRATICSSGGETLTVGMEYFSALMDDEASKTITRLDYCPLCWEKTAKKEAFERARTFWKSKVTAKKDDSLLHLNRDEKVLYLLKEAITTNDNDPETFVLALYLARKRLLYLRQELVQEGGKIVQIYEVAANEEMLCVNKMMLSQLETEKIQLELAKKLKNG